MQATPSPAVRLKPEAWQAWMARVQATHPVLQAEHLGVSRTQVDRVVSGSIAPGERFIAACMAKYDGTFEELFEVVS